MRVVGTATLTGTGIKTISVGFKPTWARFKVCSNTATQSYSHLSEGETDGNSQFVTSVFQDTSGGFSGNKNNKVVSHYERVNGNVTEVLSASFDSFTATAIRLNVSLGNSAYQVIITCGN